MSIAPAAESVLHRPGDYSLCDPPAMTKAAG